MTRRGIATAESKISLEGVDKLSLLGFNDRNLGILEQRFDARIVVRGDAVFIEGDPAEVSRLERIFKELIFILNKNRNLTNNDVETVVDLVTSAGLPGNGGASRSLQSEREDADSVILFTKDDMIRVKTDGQSRYFKAMQRNDIVFAIGPAGTGKTYLAVAAAVASLKNRQVTKIVLTRPAVEAGENLGFLPGDLREKVDPYLRPLYDALDDMLPADKLKMYIERRIIEIAPLAYMRGRTLNNAFVILDEAQNATSLQMKMFLTRLGANSRAVITGDITQIDLPFNTVSGLVEIQSILKSIEGVAFIYLDKSDVVRHRLVKDIIDAYETYRANGKKNGNGGNGDKHTPGS
jgi:phosphate starvation-inducible protein PhoH and related proteins